MAKIIAVHFSPTVQRQKYNTSQKRLNFIRFLGVNPIKRVHKTPTGWAKYRIKRSNPDKNKFTKIIDGVNVIFES